MRVSDNRDDAVLGTLLPSYSAMKDSSVPGFGSIPAHWQVVRVKNLCRMRSGDSITAESIKPAGVYPVYGGNGRRGYASRYTHDGVFVLIGRQGALCGNVHLARGRFWASEHAVVATACSEYVPEWLGSILTVMDLNQHSIAAAQPGLSVERVLNLRLAVPPASEQAAIARFIDHADRSIRRYIRAKQKLIALLEEQKQAVIHEAVTGQIDVRTGRPYPAYWDSGIEWLGAVPAHWDVRRSKRVFRPRTELARSGDTQLSATQTHGVIAQADYEERIGRKVTKILRHLDRRRHVEVDDFVISMRSFQGGLERAWRSGCIRSSYVVLQAATTELAIGYFGHLFKSVGYIRALQSTANFIRDGQDLNFENFCRVDVPFPPIEEQRQIARAVDGGMDHIASSIERSRRQIGSLQEYRARLIADVVTGKLDVRELAAGLPHLDPLAAEQDQNDDFNRHPDSEASGDAKEGGPRLDVVVGGAV